MICARCGRETEKFYENLCLSCYVDRLKLEKIRIKNCKICGRKFFFNKFYNSNDKVIEFYIKKFLSKKFPSEVVHVLKEKMEFEEEEFLCKRCKESFSNRVVAILQLRGEKRILNELVEGLALNTKEVEGGYDIHFSSKSLMRDFVMKIKKRYVVEEKFSRKLVGLKDGKRKYKDTVLIKIYDKKIRAY
ncbi:MAG: NMD3-related protein [Candidatus Aenigmarchaeota archaeon]|nr:60S ribosomal export protein NMD3 [Candidatus Aenigmarchaeota archaeon]MDW8159880.1 NMD3-related protein [Candidatus Aenigmarchaeota archaeon]